jgi:hypothetical protein
VDSARLLEGRGHNNAIQHALLHEIFMTTSGCLMLQQDRHQVSGHNDLLSTNKFLCFTPKSHMRHVLFCGITQRRVLILYRRVGITERSHRQRSRFARRWVRNVVPKRRERIITRRCVIPQRRVLILHRRFGITYRSHLQGSRCPRRWDRYVVPKRR